MPGPLDFWKLVKEVNPKTIRTEAARPFSVAGIAAPEGLEHLRLILGLDGEAARQSAGDHWREAALPLTLDARRWISSSSFALSLEHVTDSPILTWRLDGGPSQDQDARAILDRFPDLSLALPRALPMFRREAARRVIAATAKTNTEIALASSLPGIIPWTAVLLPVTAFPDMFLLTKNQVMMCLRLAAIYGLEVDPATRIKELGSIIGAAFGWRSLARELVGAIPGGVGVVAKGGISFAATVATGRAAQAFYESGRRPTDADVHRLYEESLAKGRAIATDAWDKLKHRQEPAAA